MRKSGNGNPKTCVENLVSIVRGEVAFDRVRGIDARLIDRPADEAAQEFEQEALWNIKTYEPRTNANDARVTATEMESGGFALTVDISGAAAPME